MSSSEDLAKLIFTADNSGALDPEMEWRTAKPEYRDYAYTIADAILAAGYRKLEQVSTVEELDALPVGSVARSSREGIYEKANFHGDSEFPFWIVTGVNRELPNTAVALPATVLYEPQP